MEVISIKNLNFKYEYSDFALEDINYSLEEGEMSLLIGPIGCGKTTLLKCLKAEVSPKGELKGDIKINIPAKQIGFLFQNADASICTEKVRDEIVFFAEQTGMEPGKMKRRLAELSAYLGIEDLLDKKTSELSGGQKQIINLAAILINDPKLILLDEPTNGLDPIAAFNFASLINKLRKELKLSIIVIEHNVDIFIKMADSLVLMDNGRLIESGDVDTVCGRILNNEKYNKLLPRSVYYSENKICFSEVELINDLSREKIKKITNIDRREKVADNKSLEIKRGYFRYNKLERDALKDININIKGGMIYGIIGGNGAGKSTLLSIINGYRKLFMGKIKSDFKSAFLPQNPAYMFIKDTLIEDFNTVADKKKIDELLYKYKFFNCIGEWLNKSPYELSGGQLKKAAIFKLLLIDADLLLLDEPVNNLDGIEKAEFCEVIEELNNSGKTIIIISHDLDFIEETCDRVFFMFNGEILTEGDTLEVFNENRFFTTFRGRLLRGIDE